VPGIVGLYIVPSIYYVTSFEILPVLIEIDVKKIDFINANAS
jgi:hypothetical protein